MNRSAHKISAFNAHVWSCPIKKFGCKSVECACVRSYKSEAWGEQISVVYSVQICAFIKVEFDYRILKKLICV